MFCFVSLNFSLMLALLQLDNVEHVRQFVVFFSFSFASTFSNIPCQSKHVSLYFRCVKKSREYRRCWCTCMHVGELEHHEAFLCPGERLHSVTAAHTRWLSKESQVVVPSAAQSSVDAAHADICLRWLLRGEEKSAFPYACARRNPSLHPLLPHTALFCPSLPHSLLRLQSQPDGSLNIVYLGWRSQMQCVSIGIPIPSISFPHSSASLLAQVQVSALALKLHFVDFCVSQIPQQVDMLIYTLLLPLNYLFCSIVHTCVNVSFHTFSVSHQNSKNTQIFFFFLFFPFDQAMAFSHPHLFSMHCMWWHMGAPLWLHIEIENRPPDVASTESQMHLAPLGGVSQQHVVPTSWTSPLPSWSQI